jgi:hypothetical protein
LVTDIREELRLKAFEKRVLKRIFGGRRYRIIKGNWSPYVPHTQGDHDCMQDFGGKSRRREINRRPRQRWLIILK